MSEIRATFEPGSWKDFSREHESLRKLVESALAACARGPCPDPIAVWGAYGAGKTQFLFWVAEQALAEGLIPVYLHLNDLLCDLPIDLSPDEFRKHAAAFVRRTVDALRDDDHEEWLAEVYRDKALLEYVKTHLKPTALTPVVLVDEVEQAYLSLVEQVRADDRSPLRAWLEEGSFKILAFAVGSLYVLGRADRERLTVRPIPPVHPRSARELCDDLPASVVNGLWWLSRGKPRHFMKAAKAYRLSAPASAADIHALVSNLDSVSQAPYEGETQSAVPAAYLDQLDAAEVGLLLSIGPRLVGSGALLPVSVSMSDVLLPILQGTFGLESIAYDLVRYVMLLCDAVSVDGTFALTERDTPFLLRLAVDFLLEFERERLEQDTVEGNAALRKLLEIHDHAKERAGEVFWKLHGKLENTSRGEAALPFETLASAFPLPTTSPTLFGTDPTAVRARFEESKQPVFAWRDRNGNHVLFMTSVATLYAYASSRQFRQAALAPSTGVVVLLPYDSTPLHPAGFLEWLGSYDRLRVVRLPLALTDFLLSLRASSSEGHDPISVAQQAEVDKNLKRQVRFYRGRLESFTAEVGSRPYPLVPSPLPRPLQDLERRVADKAIVSLSMCQAFESMTPPVLNYLADLRSMVQSTKGIWDRRVAPGFVALSEALPHRSSRTGRPEVAKVVDDLKAAFAPWMDALAGLASHVEADDMDFLSEDRAGAIALQALWQVKRGITEDEVSGLNAAARQLAEVVAVAKSLENMERRLHEFGIRLDLGDLAPLLESLGNIETTSANAAALVKGRTTSDKQLARCLYLRFVSAFLANVETDVVKAKTSVLKLRERLEDVSDARERLRIVATADVARFAGIEAEAMAGLVDALVADAVAAVGSTPSLEEVLSELDTLSASLDELEGCWSELSDAFEEIQALIAETQDGD